MSAESPTPASGGGGKLESLAKDDLIKFAKRQTILLGKAKAKIDELAKKGATSEDTQGLIRERDDLQAELQGLKAELTNSKEGTELLQKQLDGLSEELVQVKTERAEAEEERLSAVEAYQSLQTTLEKTASNQDGSLNRLEEKLAKSSSRVQALEEENECLKMQHTSTLDSVKAIQLEYQKALEEKQSLSDQHQKTCSELVEANRIKDKVVVSFKALKQKYLETKKELESKNDSESTESASAADDYAKLNSELEDKRKEYDIQTESLTALRKDCDEQIESQSKLQGEYDTQRESLSRLQKEHDEQTASLSGLREENESVTLQLTQYAEQASTGADNSATKYEAQLEEWKTKVSMMRKEFTEDSQRQKAEITALTAELQQVREANAQSKQRVEELVLGLGKESAGVISQYEEKIVAYEAEKEGLLRRLEEVSVPQDKSTEEVKEPIEATDNNASSEVTNEEASTTDATASLGDEAMLGSITEKEALLNSVYEDLQQANAELLQERQLSKSLQDMMKTLSDTLRGLESENKSLKVLGRENETPKAEDQAASETADSVAGLPESAETEKDRLIAQLQAKLSELVDYASKLKTKCQMLLQTNDDLTQTVEQQSRRLMNDARGARNLELHFQEAENNVNEQIAHFHSERDEMIANVEEYAASIERLREEMTPFKAQEKQCVTVMYKGLCLLTDKDPDEEEAPKSSLLELARVILSSAIKYKSQSEILAKEKQASFLSELWMKRVTLNWKYRSDEEARLRRELTRTVEKLEKKIEELGADPIHREQDTEEYKASFEKQEMGDEDLEKQAAKFREEELQRIYKHCDKLEREIKELKRQLAEKGESLVAGNGPVQSREDSRNDAHVNSEESRDKEGGVDVGSNKQINSSGVANTSQSKYSPDAVYIESSTSDRDGDKADTAGGKSVEVLQEIVDSLRLELSTCSEASSELEALKAKYEGENSEVNELTRSLETASSRMSTNDEEIEILNATVTRLKARLEHQADNLVELNVQLAKNQLQDEFHIRVGDTHQAKMQTDFSTAVVDLKNANDEKEALIAQIQQLKSAAAAVSSSVKNDDLEKVGAELEATSNRVEKLENEVLELISKNTKYVAQNENLISQVDDLTANSEALQRDLEELMQQLESKCEQLTSEKEDIQGKREELQEQISALVDQVKAQKDAFQTEQEALQHNLDSCKMEREKYSAELFEVQRERDEMTARFDGLTKTNVESLTEQERADATKTALAEKLREELLSLQEKMARLEEERDSGQKALEHCRCEQERSFQDLERVQAEKAEVDDRVEELMTQIKDRSITTDQLQAELGERDLQISRLEEGNRNLEGEVREAQLVIENFRGEISGFTQQVDQLHGQNDDYQSRIEDFKLLQKSFNSLQEQHHDMVNVVQSLKLERDDLKNLLEEKDGQLSELSEDMVKAEGDKDESNRLVLLVDEQKMEINRLTEAVTVAKQQNEDLQRMVEVHQSKVEELSINLENEKVERATDNSNLNTEIAELSGNAEKLRKGKGELLVQAEEQQAEIEKLSMQAADLRSELETTRRELMETSISSQTSAASEESSETSAKLKDAEDRANKFKLIALKAKKELMESKAMADKLRGELQTASSNKVGDMQTLMNNYQHLQQDLDRLQDELDSEHSKVATLQGQLEAEQTTSAQIQTRLTSVIEERGNVVLTNSQLLAKIKAFESQQIEWKTTMSSLEKEADAKQIEVNELNKNVHRLSDQLGSNEANSKSLEEKLRGKINELEMKVHEARDELEQANKTVSKSSVMDLEIADFEKTVSTLEGAVRDKQESITNLEQELKHLQQKYASLQHELASADEQRQSVESRSDKLQQSLNRTKQDLDDAKQQENESKTTDLAVRGELEVLRQQHEDLKLEISTITSGRLGAEGKLKSFQDSQQRLIRSMENKQRALQSDLESSRGELTALQQDYDGYKIRVHSVLKQQQTRASVEAALESEKLDKEHVQEVLNQVKVKLQETSDKLNASLSESSLQQDELDKLSLKHNKLSQDFTNKETVWRQRLDQLMLENSTIAAEHSSAITQMSQHTEIMTQTFKEQVKASQTEHEHQVGNLNSRIGRLEDEKVSLVGEVQNLRQQIGSSKVEQAKITRQHSRQQTASPVLASTSDVKYNIRESGEGMEYPQPSQLPGSSANVPQVGATNTLAGLEQLLGSADDDAVSVVSMNSGVMSETGDEAKLRTKLHLSEKQLEHLRELLNDSEATCMRYNEQVKILKQEIRRLESNQQRENSISNMEYLKNIVYKFISLESGDERARLLPVLHTMLKFTDEELSTLRGIATTGSEAEASGQGQSQGSWSGYLHRWTGFSS